MSNREVWVDNIKGFAIITVVLGHCIQYFMYDGNELFWIDPVFDFIYSFHMSLFAFVSGYLAFSFCRKYKICQALLRKAKTILVPCLVWCIIEMKLDNQMSLDPQNFLERNWFLWSVFYCSVAIIISHHLKKWGGILSILLIISGFFIPEFSNVIDFKMMYPFFALGYVVKKYEFISYYNHLNCRLRLLLLGLAATFYVLLMTLVADSDVLSAWNVFSLNDGVVFVNCIKRWAVNLAGSVLFVAIFCRYDRKCAFLTLFGGETLGIYMVQTCVFQIARSKGMCAWVASCMDGSSYILKELLIIVIAIIILLICSLLISLMKKNKFVSLIFLGR